MGLNVPMHFCNSYVCMYVCVCSVQCLVDLYYDTVAKQLSSVPEDDIKVVSKRVGQ